MGQHIILDFLKNHPVSTKDELINMYTYFKFKAYLQTTMRCTKKAYRTKNFKTSSMVNIISPDELCKISDSSAHESELESMCDLSEAVEHLAPNQAMVIKLYYYQGKTDLEISQIRKVSRQAVNCLKQRALRNLLRLLDDKKIDAKPTIPNSPLLPLSPPDHEHLHCNTNVNG